MATKEEIKSNFQAGDVPTEQDFAELIDKQVGVLDSSNDLPTASSSNENVCYLVGGDTIYRCEETGGVYTWVAYPFAQSAVNNYLNLSNKPAINGHTLGKNNSLKDIGAAAATHTHNYAGSVTAGGAANSVANSLTIAVQGVVKQTYDGSSAKTIDMTMEEIAGNVKVLADMSVPSIADNDYIVLYRTSEDAAYKVKMTDLKTYLNS